MTTQQIETRFADAARRRLMTVLVERPLRDLRPGEILAEVLCVPLHGSFWLASHPDLRHPRKEAFLKNGRFVFGNGGVGRVVAIGDSSAPVEPGDDVVLFGHLPCTHADCRGCWADHRYTECEYGESTIIGHGDGAPDGSYARHVILPPYAYERASLTGGRVAERDLLGLMYGFLVADVRNAITRYPATAERTRVLLFGAGQSGRIATYLHLLRAPHAKILVVDSSQERAEQLQAFWPRTVDVWVPQQATVDALNASAPLSPDAIDAEIESLARAMERHFGRAKCDFVFEASSGQTAPLWSHPRILGPGAECVLFGFGADHILLDQRVVQISGLTIRMSRGVGNLENRKEVVRLIKSDASDFVERQLRTGALRLDGLDAAINFIRAQHDPPKPLHAIPPAFIVPGGGVTS